MTQAAEGFSERWRWPTWTVSMVAFPPARGSIVHRFDSQELVESLIQINPPRARGVAYGRLESATACVLTSPTSFMACRRWPCCPPCCAARYIPTRNPYEVALVSANGLDTDFSAVDVACRI